MEAHKVVAVVAYFAAVGVVIALGIWQIVANSLR